MLHSRPTICDSNSRDTGSDAAKITASTRVIHSRQRSSGGNREVRYALILTLRAQTTIDLYTEIANAIGVDVEVETA